MKKQTKLTTQLQLPNRNFSMTFTFYKYTFRNKEIVRNILFVNNRDI